MASYRTVTVTATIATNTVTADADGQQVIVTDPYVAVETVEEGVLLTVRDAHEETQAVIYNGQKGDKGNPGVDGFSPTITAAEITGGHRLTITDNAGTQTVDVMNGAKGDPGQPGQDYVLTAQDKQEIADIVLADLPTWTGGSY